MHTRSAATDKRRVILLAALLGGCRSESFNSIDNRFDAPIQLRFATTTLSGAAHGAGAVYSLTFQGTEARAHWNSP